MQEVFQQIRERHRQNPNHIHGRGRPLANPNPKPVHPLDLRSCIPPENLKASSLQQGSNNGKSCAKRECLCDLTSAIARKVPTKPHLEPNEKERSFTLLADLREQEEGEGLAGDNNDEDCSARRSSHRWNSDSLSFARHCEAKLEDLLNLDGSALNTFNESPDAQRTDACFHVLEELCENKLPFSCVLQHICDELRGALYQKSQDRTRKASSEQVRAYFELAHELEGEVAQMEAENSSWQSSVLAQDHDLLDTKGELQELADELSKANCASNELEEKLSAAEQALSSEKEKVNGLREKIKKLKKEMKDIRHEVRCAQQIDATKASEVEEYEKLKALYMQLVHEFQHAQAFLHASQCEVAESASKADLIAAKAEILDLGDKIYQVQAQIDAFAAETRLLTPRPQWGGQVPGMDKPLGLSTAQQIERICRENAFLAASTSRLQIDFAATGVTLAEIQEHGTNTARSEKKEKPEGNSTAMKSKGRGRVKEKTQKR